FPFCFFLHSPSPLAISTLSYTTLFRSSREWSGRRIQCARERPFGADDRESSLFQATLESSHRCECQYRRYRVANDARDERRTARDRKSTRLNSSHQIISYAVFCLKKKK